MEPRRRRAFTYGLAALVGVVVGHAIAYVAAIPEPGHRHVHLAETGHNYWPVASLLAVIAIAGLLLSSAGSGMARGIRGHRIAPRELSVNRLAAVQVGAFLAIELLERAHVGVFPVEMLSSRAFLAGVAVQLGIAFVICRLVAGVEAVAALVGAACSRQRRRHGPVASRPLRRPDRRRRIADGLVVTAGPRAPPPALAS